RLEVAHELDVTAPAFVLVEQHDVQRRRVCGAEVRRMWPFLEGGKFAIAQLVEDAPGVLVPEVVDPRALPVTERAQRRRREFGRERQGLQAREDAVATEPRHE